MPDSIDAPAVHRDYHFAQLPEWVLYHPDLSAQAVRVFGALDRHAGTAGSCYPSLSRLSQLLGCSQDTVRRALADLAEVGAVTVIPTYVEATGEDGEPTGKMRQTANTYELHGAPPSEVAAPPPSTSATPPPSADAGPRRRARKNESQKEPRGDQRLVGVSDDALASATSETFDATWALYPRKLNRKGAQKAWVAQVRKGSDPAAMRRAVENYARLREGRDPTTTMHGATFFGPNDRWEDYVDGIPEAEVPRPERKESRGERNLRIRNERREQRQDVTPMLKGLMP